MKIRRESPITGNVHEMDINVTPAQVSDIVNRMKPIDVIAPQLTEDEMEFIVTGIPPTEWREFFADAVVLKNI